VYPLVCRYRTGVNVEGLNVGRAERKKDTKK
jgi:hypothetical protein